MLIDVFEFCLPAGCVYLPLLDFVLILLLMLDWSDWVVVLIITV